MTIYINRAGSVFPQEDAENFSKSLTPATYSVEMSLFGFYLQRTPDVQKNPERIYGNIRSRANRIIETYEDRLKLGKNTGVLLSGVKGSGKTMLARMLSEEMMKKEYATIVVGSIKEDALDSFMKFMNLITCPVVVLFDEFEKNFGNNEQLRLLSMFDGTSQGNKLFVITVNDEYKLNTFMLNRPGRIYYRFCYHGLERDSVVEFLNDNLKNKSMIQDVADKIDRAFKNTFTFDMLQTAVEEMNRYNLSFVEAVADLNIDVKETVYSVELFKDGKERAKKTVSDIDDFFIFDPQVKEHIHFDYESDFKCYDAEKDSMVFEADGYHAYIRTTTKSNRSRSYFMDAL